MGNCPNQRNIEANIERELEGKLSYSEYLCLDKLLTAQNSLSSPPHHDEMLFIIQHQTSELWLKLILHELKSAICFIQKDQLGPCLKNLARVKQILRQLFEQWAVLETLTPSEYAEFRHVLKSASGFQSGQYRMVEFILGNKNSDMMNVFSYDSELQQAIRQVLDAPSIYDEFMICLSRLGHQLSTKHVQRDWSIAHQFDDDLVNVFHNVYSNRDKYWDIYAMCERLVDVEESFQLWRFRHMKTVERIIGQKQGTGGSSGVGFLKQALDLSFFPELLAVRTRI